MLLVIALFTGGNANGQEAVYPTVDEIEWGIRYIWPDELEDWAIAVVQCESTTGQDYRTYDFNQIHAGPWQFSQVTWRPYFENLGYDWFWIVVDPVLNASAAWEIYTRQGPGAWPNCPRWYR